MTPQSWVQTHLQAVRWKSLLLPPEYLRLLKETAVGTVLGWIIRLNPGAVVGGILGFSLAETQISGLWVGGLTEITCLVLFAESVRQELWEKPELATEEENFVYNIE